VSFASAKGGGEGIGKTRRGKGVKILAIVDRHGAATSSIFSVCETWAT
jgi:hypothetical protein